MPTARQRYTITETPQITEAIRLAAERWPADKRRGARLLVRVLADWAHSGAADHNRRRAAILATRGTAYPDEFSADYLEELRSEWPR